MGRSELLGVTTGLVKTQEVTDGLTVRSELGEAFIYFFRGHN